MKSSATWVTVPLLLLSMVAAVPSGMRGCTQKVKESVQPPLGWVKSKPAPADHLIELRIGLPQTNFAELEKHLYEISDPFHSRYGEHLSKEEVEALIAPHPDSIDAINQWLTEYGISMDSVSRSPAKDWAKVKVPVRIAEEMLGTEYHVWTHLNSGDSLVRTTSYSLPDVLHEHVDVIQPTTMFARMKGMKSTLRKTEQISAVTDTESSSSCIPDATAYGGCVDVSCNSTVTPTCLKQLYNAVDYTPQVPGENQIAVTGYLEEYANYEDLYLFYETYVPAAVNSSFTTVYINGGLNNQTPSAAGGEANLDTQYAFGITYPTPATFYTTGGSPPFDPDDLETTDSNEPYSEWLDYILEADNPPQTISTSYGDDEQTVPYSYAVRVCAGFAQLGARGVSIMFSSGDGGVGDGDPDPATQECYTNDGRNVTEFIPGFPASCPYVTAVGGTTEIPEVAAYFSGGGFSRYFSRPAYQEAVVDEYLAGLTPGVYEGLYNPDGRGYPDVSAQSENFVILWDQEDYLVAGTSCSSPTFTAFVSLLNDARLASGLPALGFLNPLIYALGVVEPSAFNDITVGSNPGCGTQGFNATAGWDAVTGFGTPNFAVLKDIVLGNVTGTISR